MKKNKFIIVLIAILVFVSMSAPVWAWQNDKQCGQAKMKLEAKFLWEIKALLAHKDMLNLKEEQVKQIKELHITTKKELIRSNAEIEIVSIDIKTNLFDSDKIDIKIMEKLLDQKFKVKKDEAKMLVKAFAQVQNILNKEQQAMLKGLIDSAQKPYSKSMKCGSEKPMGMCPMSKAPEAMSK